MSIIDFMHLHPLLTFFLAFILGITIVGVTDYISQAFTGNCNYMEEANTVVKKVYVA